MNKSRLSYAVAAAVALMTLAVYISAIRNDFVNWDDGGYVLEHFQIRSLNGEFFKWAFTDLSHGFWHPLTWISHAMDYALWGLNPLGHHLTSIILHAINTALVVVLVLKLLEIARERSTPNPDPSFS